MQGCFCVRVDLLGLTPLPQLFCSPLPLLTHSFSLSLVLCGRILQFLPVCLRGFADVWNVNSTCGSLTPQLGVSPRNQELNKHVQPAVSTTQ